MITQAKVKCKSSLSVHTFWSITVIPFVAVLAPTWGQVQYVPCTRGTLNECTLSDWLQHVSLQNGTENMNANRLWELFREAACLRSYSSPLEIVSSIGLCKCMWLISSIFPQRPWLKGHWARHLTYQTASQALPTTAQWWIKCKFPMCKTTQIKKILLRTPLKSPWRITY